MRFEFATATKIVFGAGTVHDIAPALKGLGKRTLVVTGHSRARSDGLIHDIQTAGVACVPFGVDGEPTVDQVRRGVQLARAEGCDVVTAMGGGSAIDGAKAIAALLTNTGDVLDYLEIVGQGKPIDRPSAPFVAVPTTAGTGSEVTRNAVLGSPRHQVKASLRSALMLPRMAVVDPELTLDLPPAITASTGLDALTQVIEPYVSVRANPMTDMFCVEGMTRVSRSLLRAFEDGRDIGARTNMAFASLMGGLSLANAGLGAVHGFAAPVGGMFPAPHGAVCAALLPHVMEVNIRALEERAPSSNALRRYAGVARILTGRPDAEAGDGVAWVRSLCRSLRIPPLGSYGVCGEHIPALADKAAQASSMKGNPITLTREELRDIMAHAM
jgi:alcohol dehydrogenase class IV